MSEQAETAVKELPLGSQYASEGIEMLPICGWHLPAHFGDPELEYEAGRSGAALFNAGFLSIVRATGKDHIEYLNRRLSQRVIESTPGQGFRANQLGGDGRMEADLELFRTAENESLLIAPPAITGAYLAAVADKYVFTEDAQFVDETEQWCAFALVGPGAGKILQGLGLSLPPDNLQLSTGKLAGADVVLIKSTLFFGSWLILGPAEKAAEFEKTLHHVAPQRMGFLAFDTLRVETGTPWFGIDLSERSIPLEADLMIAIHTNKGCYPGQETIAKILNLGHPARKLVGVVWEADDPLPANSTITVDGKEAGILSSSTFSPRFGKAIGLAMMKWNHRTAGTEVTGEGDISGHIVELPFS